MIKVHYYKKEWIKDSSERLDSRVCVYGGTAAGVIAACTIARSGKSVILTHPGVELGGMTTGGLSYTDFGNAAIFGGLSREFYARTAKYYNELTGSRKELSFVFEPHVATKILEEMLSEYGVTVIGQAFLDRCLLQEGEGAPRISELRFLGGLRITADAFMDCTYEGDLMAAAGVTFVTGRESNNKYGETHNGFQMEETHQFDVDIDPFVEEGRRESGLLPELDNARFYSSRDIKELTGTGDRLIQAYNFRMCMEKDPANRLPFPKPPGYDPRRYELLRRWLVKTNHNYIMERQGEEFIRKFDSITDTKTDTNNHGPFSTDYIGGNGNWINSGYEEREKIFQDQLDFQMGYHFFMANDPGVPEKYRKIYARWGLAKDEFLTTDNWPHQLYIREGRRMVSDYVITEDHCMSRKICDDPVAMGAYQMDSHNCQRIIVDGRVKNEGDVQYKLPRPYGISYRSCIPARGECGNLAVPVAVSASHIAFGSIRMEPVFMMLAESLGEAVLMSLEEKADLQEIDYGKLSSRLITRGQILETDAENRGDGNPALNGPGKTEP